MAGAGYKLFNTGDVLTAAQVNTYLMEQTVMVFADAAARTAALSGVVSEGMISYLKDTNAVEVYNGSAWVASDDPNAIQNTIVDAKGDLITATAADTPARLAVGNNGESLVADSSASTGLRWQGNFAAGKNKIINGDFSIWQRGTSITLPNSFAYTYTADRWVAFSDTSSSATVTQQTFTPGTAPVAGYEGSTFLRYYTANTGVGHILLQRIEDVRTFAGQTVTISFWAKAASALNFTSYSQVVQRFGSGGSGDVITYPTFSPSSITTSWQRFTATVNVPSVSGKTIGSGSMLQIQIGAAGNNTLDIWGFQVEAGSVATAFQTATGTLAGELAACQRYYWRAGGNDNYQRFGIGISASSATVVDFPIFNPVPLRIATPSVEYANLAVFDGTTVIAVTNVTRNANGTNVTMLAATASGLTSFRAYEFLANNSGTAYLALNAEL